MFFANSIKNLVEAMTDAHGFLSEANALSCINSHLEIVTALSTQTVECSYFIKDVTKNTGLSECIPLEASTIENSSFQRAL